ncbi:MAG: aminotransferase class V-fold PLP-dependent enzyme [Acidobacteriota bacterium]|nr:aminotransferase class V-fold PLP-dependent enzyme [Acidobacteriota bacterium]
MSLLLDDDTRATLWRALIDTIEDYTTHVQERRVTPELAPQKIRSLLSACDFAAPMPPIEALDFAARGLTEYQVHTPHPRYFGLFNPAPTTMGIAADALVAAFNPQMAAWSHSPFAVEVEQHLLRCFGERFGYDPKTTDGTFTSGGAEANHTAMLTALTHVFPEFPAKGIRGLSGQPVLYVSSESHHSLLKAAKMSGIGRESVREVAVDGHLRMLPSALDESIERDRAAGFLPFMVAGTAGTTNAGAIDPLAELAEVAQKHGTWFHVDAAWGGAAALVPELQPLLRGIEQADSITFDAHKWLSVPMGAGLYLTRHMDIMDQTFRTQTSYMPKEAAGLDIIDPHLHTIQWSRRFIGLKVFLSLLTAGWEGYAEALRHQTRMGALLRTRLAAEGWTIENKTVLPVVCFSDPFGTDPHSAVMQILSSGEAWISTTSIQGRTVFRACITNYRTQPEDVEKLIESLAAVRQALVC